MRRMLTALAGLLLVAGLAPARGPTPARLRWAAGQVLLYRSEHATHATEVTGDSRSETKSLVRLTKRWQVTAVDAAGVATLTLSIVAMYQERTTFSGEVLKYDSADPDKSTPQLKEALSRYLNVPLATVRVDPLGRVVEVKESKSDASAYEAELPFLVALPAAGLAANEGWERTYKITLAPPLGTGEKYDAVQRYRCKALTPTEATVTLTTALKDPPKAAADAMPLWQMLPEGEVVLDLKNGRLHSAKLEVKKEVKDHEGEGSRYTFASTLTVQYAGDR